jgi:transcriptional regulator with XRE-family HTH domain
MTAWTFAEHVALARSRPAYWSYLTQLEFIDRLVAEMDAQGVSAAELARRMGTSRAWVSKVLRGENNLTVASMGKLAFALGLRVRADLAPLEEASGVETPDTVEEPRTADRSHSVRQTA